MKVTLVVPTWDEIDGMKAIMPQINRDWVDQILVTDGGSTDGTIEYARENGYQVYVQKKKGIRYCYSEILDLIEGDIMITFSPDGNSLPEKIPPLIEKMKEGYDMVIVSRYKDDAKSEDDDIMTGFGNWLFTGTINLLHGGKYTDAMVMYRAYKTKILRELDIDQDSSYSTPEFFLRTKLGCEPLISVRALKRGLKVGEIPGDEPPRIGGKRKLLMFQWGAGYYYQIWREKLFWK
jgi:glycosyltransferase involved in cell wall biosynthesis